VPAFPPVAAKLLAMFGQESVQLRDIADVIARDPTFSARVLQCANSVTFGHESEITNVRQALTMLGLDRAQHVTVSLATTAYMQPSVHTEDLKRCWKHMVACGLLSQAIAAAAGLPSDVAYTAGILHDIGRLGLLVAYPSEYETVIRDAAERSLDLLDYERERFGVDHCEAGRFLAERWRLPEVFHLVAGRHHDSPDGSQLDLLTIVHYACRAADALGFDVTRPLQRLTLKEALDGLPARAVNRLLRSAENLQQQTEDQVQMYSKELEPKVALRPPELEADKDESEDSEGGQFTAEIDLSSHDACETGPSNWPSWLTTTVALVLLGLLYAFLRSD
jgi:HD-like signal output (HDOD) protein